MLNRNIPHLQRHSGGFSLLEVLVSILVLSIGMLGAAGMFTRAIENSTDTERRQMAAMLASELMETMRADAPRILNPDGSPKSDLGGYAFSDGTTISGVCNSSSTVPSDRLLCWRQRAEQLMPEIATVNTSMGGLVVTETAGVVSITVAWPVKKGQCLAEGLPPNADYCTYTLRSKL